MTSLGDLIGAFKSHSTLFSEVGNATNYFKNCASGDNTFREAEA